MYSWCGGWCLTSLLPCRPISLAHPPRLSAAPMPSSPPTYIFTLYVYRHTHPLPPACSPPGLPSKLHPLRHPPGLPSSRVPLLCGWWCGSSAPHAQGHTLSTPGAHTKGGGRIQADKRTDGQTDGRTDVRQAGRTAAAAEGCAVKEATRKHHTFLLLLLLLLVPCLCVCVPERTTHCCQQSRHCCCCRQRCILAVAAVTPAAVAVSVACCCCSPAHTHSTRTSTPLSRRSSA